MAEHAVKFDNVSKAYGENKVVKNITLEVPRGHLATFIGPSGCGKTTSLKMINRLIEPTSGRIMVEGQDIQQVNPVELRRNIGYVIQQIGLFPHMTIEENIGLVPRLKRSQQTNMVKRTEELLDLIGLDPSQFRKRYPNELSGGQQQRIGVARALAADPSIILMDEPFSALDPISREQLQDELVKLQGTLHKTIVFVTHDMDEALKIADLIVLMRAGQVVQAATPEQILRHPGDDFVREFVGEQRFQNAAIHLRAEDVIVPAVTIFPSRGMAEAVRLMRRHRVNGLIVTDSEGAYQGVISSQEIFANYGNESARTGDVATKNVTTVTADSDINEVVELLEHGGRGYLPVLNERNKLLGVVTRSSLIEVLSSPYKTETDEHDDTATGTEKTQTPGEISTTGHAKEGDGS